MITDIRNLIAARRDEENDEGGFTLIELLIVIVVLGILAAVVVFAVGGISDRGKKSACKSDLKSVEVATEAYYAKSTSTPPAYPAATNATPTDDNTERLQVLVDADGSVLSDPANCAVS